ncbi:(S)-benzoin forming benzil reductase [Virgibacillus soli]|uniref:(S)-benzoin forming benzil reductase n=1 Tax=Paracerasibacillus soli TaxID=480284 RepID=A0ABU5CN61_9BACI|nr:(S)-benzoin forming benzil reductase [Virgibacillus soli]MDY0407793.1 (S)-benzoin forming benzil reductase [Virgibacillus soli]
MQIAIITGTSRGLGEALAILYLKQRIPVIGISRKTNDRLENIAEVNNTKYEHITCDLKDIAAVQSTIFKIKEKMTNVAPTEVFLINNAAMVEPIHQAGELDEKELTTHIQVNVTAPMLMTNALLQFSSQEKIPFKIATITSGAAERPVYGWSAYCSTKAALNMYTKTVALEQEELNTDNKIIAFSPGIMDTEMQRQIRTRSHEEFIEIESFRNYKETNKLKQPEIIATILFDILNDCEQIKNGTIYHARDYF